MYSTGYRLVLRNEIHENGALKDELFHYFKEAIETLKRNFSSLLLGQLQGLVLYPGQVKSNESFSRIIIRKMSLQGFRYSFDT